ncbi:MULTISPECIES: DNA-3-methyladenine glycosylase family protein [unclassified Desulfovibrio]|uniref:DNA-3-methyladenine glycosylase family protein n=1 Tax=unclassified Desulfovibrio TaxID=2593640 RepID=UPI0021AB889C|nr:MULTISPECIES: DNA-3-methyladenine glycosylase 2 family protein [unclassified Desulfovibrio]
MSHDNTALPLLPEAAPGDGTDAQAYFAYGEAEIAHLKKKDKALARLIETVGPVRREVIPDIFMALVHAIIGQQISAKAHLTVWKRACAMFAPLTPEHVASIPAATLQTCGISLRKAAYVSEIARDIMSGRLDLAQLHGMDDDAVCRRLSEIRGIGMWTAEMLMTFSMQRKNILSRGDLAIQRGLRMLYRHRAITPALFARYKKRYAPHATVAGLYLWALAGGAYAGYADPAAPQPPKKPGQKHKNLSARTGGPQNGQSSCAKIAPPWPQSGLGKKRAIPRED